MIEIISIIVIIIFLLYIYYNIFDDVSYYKSNIDGKNYEVRSLKSIRNTFPGPIESSPAADYLAILSKKVNILVDYMHTNKLPNSEISYRLYNRWSQCKLRETNSNETSVAYTVNKGEEMRICIRSGLKKFEDINTALFVILHELAHIMSISYGHNEEFRENFSYIIHLASSLNLYRPQDFSTSPVEYCGTEINTTPCSDGSCSL